MFFRNFDDDLPIIEMYEEEWEILEKRSSKKWEYPITLSVNKHYECWIDRSWGYHHDDEEREYINIDDYTGLRDIIDIFLYHRPEGGRFHIGKKHVYMAYNGEIIAEIMFINEK